ncbi:celCCD, partial [Symbiodinium pilosum]
VVSIQRDAIVQSHARSGDCTGIIDAMGRGINLGNVFDFNQGDRNPEVVKPHIKWAKDT